MLSGNFEKKNGNGKKTIIISSLSGHKMLVF